MELECHIHSPLSPDDSSSSSSVTIGITTTPTATSPSSEPSSSSHSPTPSPSPSSSSSLSPSPYYRHDHRPRKRRRIEELPKREIWECPFLCGKRYRKTSRASLRRHQFECRLRTEQKKIGPSNFLYTSNNLEVQVGAFHQTTTTDSPHFNLHHDRLTCDSPPTSPTLMTSFPFCYAPPLPNGLHTPLHPTTSHPQPCTDCSASSSWVIPQTMNPTPPRTSAFTLCLPTHSLPSFHLQRPTGLLTPPFLNMKTGFFQHNNEFCNIPGCPCTSQTSSGGYLVIPTVRTPDNHPTTPPDDGGARKGERVSSNSSLFREDKRKELLWSGRKTAFRIVAKHHNNASRFVDLWKKKSVEL